MHRRLLSSGRFDVPAHLKQTFFTPLTGRCMIVGRPIWRYPLADVRQPQSEVAPLITAIRDLPSESRPFRMVSHEDATSQVFNASFFVDEPTMNSFLQWYDENALNPSGPYHECLKAPAADEVPTPETLLFGAGTSVLADTRFGEYQLGMAVRYSRYELLSAAARAEAAEEAASAEFEGRIAACMHEHGVSYFGRLVMSAGEADGPGSFLTVSRYGSLADAERGSAAVRALLAPEMEHWFVEPTRPGSHIIGTASRVLEL